MTPPRHRKNAVVKPHAHFVMKRSGSSDNVLTTSSPFQHLPHGHKQRPGSESDILERPNPLHHIDSLQLGHSRPEVTNHRLTLLNTARQIKPVYIWNEVEVLKWMRKHAPNAFINYANNFKKHDVTGRTLLSLNEFKLTRLGITNKQISDELIYEILKLRMKNHMNAFKGLQTAGMFDVQL